MHLLHDILVSGKLKHVERKMSKYSKVIVPKKDSKQLHHKPGRLLFPNSFVACFELDRTNFLFPIETSNLLDHETNYGINSTYLETLFRERKDMIFY